MRANLDMDCLRTFVSIADAGSFATAAERVGRTASAVSQQISRLEQQTGAKLFRKSGRRMTLSPEGERLLATARQILALNDQVVEALADASLSGEIAVGAVQDVADSILPAVLSRFKSAHPDLRILARVDRTRTLLEAVESGALDLAVGFIGAAAGAGVKVHSEPMLWFGARTFELSEDRPIPLIAFEPPCTFREAAIKSLNEAGREWEVVFSSPSLSGLRAAMEAGLGVTARTATSFQGRLQDLSQPKGLPTLPSADFGLFTRAEPGEAAGRLGADIAEEFAASRGAPVTPAASRPGPSPASPPARRTRRKGARPARSNG